MEQVTLRFYAELNDFLPPERRMTVFAHSVFLHASVKDVIESLGVPPLPEFGVIKTELTSAPINKWGRSGIR